MVRLSSNDHGEQQILILSKAATAAEVAAATARAAVMVNSRAATVVARAATVVKADTSRVEVGRHLISLFRI